MRTIVLASTSRFRSELLGRLKLPFTTFAPNIDESPLEGEAPLDTACRLAQHKAAAAATAFPDALIIGSDQVAHRGTSIYGKPGTRANARRQLREMSGAEICFDTALCLLDATSGKTDVICVPTHVGFRRLEDDDIERYLDREDALDCAGSAKSEGLGIALLDYIRGNDPTALIGLPLIALSGMLRRHGISVP